MVPVHLHIPCLVQQFADEDHSTYSVRPIFTGGPYTSHSRFDQALDHLRTQLKQHLNNWQFNRQTASDFLWFAFDPELAYQKVSIKFKLGNKPHEGVFSYFSFNLEDRQFGILPGFDCAFFMIDPDGPSLQSQVTPIIIDEIQQRFKEDPAGFDLDTHLCPRKEFITHLELHVQVLDPSFKFQEEQQNFLSAFLAGTVQFKGNFEIWRVSELLNYSYPENLARAYFRETEVELLTKFMFEPKSPPVVIVAPEGSGRHAILEEVVYQYLKETADNASDEPVNNVWLLDPNQVIAGMSYVGWWEKRFEAILKYLASQVGGREVLVIDNPLALLRIGRTSQSSLNLARLLRPYLEKRAIPMVLIATPGQWKIMQEQDSALARQFHILNLKPVSPELAIRIVLKKKRWLEKKFDAYISLLAIQELVRLHRIYFSDHALPGYVVRQLEQLLRKNPLHHIDIQEVRTAFGNLSGWKSRIIEDEKALQAGEIRSRIEAELIGQEEAVEAISGAIHVVRSKLNNPGKPYHSFLFVGPTGVGKTQAAKVLCHFLTGSEKNLVRLDMNEYLDAAASQRLIGTWGQPEGHLTSRIRYQPFSVLLLDEIEKAHPSVVDLLLQVLDDGRLTDSRGRMVDFTNTFIILTSNLGSREAASRLGFRSANWDASGAYQKALRNHFRPEFLNRIDRTVIFKPLGESEILNIARLQIRELLSRDGFVRRTTILNIESDALEWVARRGYDPQMGGRALKRQIERDLTRLSAEQLVRIPDDHPILFDILLENRSLVPRIKRLSFVSRQSENWHPELPTNRQTNTFFRKLLQRLDLLEQQVLESEPEQANSFLAVDEASENWQYYHFRDRISEIKDLLQKLLLGHRDPHFQENRTQAFRFRKSPLKEEQEESIFRPEALSEIRELHRSGQLLYTIQESEFLHAYLMVAQLEHSGKFFLLDQFDRLTIRLEACVNNQDEKPLEFLFDQYRNWLEAREITHEANSGNYTIECEDFGLKMLLQGEAGLHFFVGPFGSPLPIRLILEDAASRDSLHQQDEVIRIYDRENTLTDLRTGLTIDYYTSPDEWNVLVFAGLHQK